MAIVSIITPVYNAGLFLDDTYQSIKNQTFTDWEWIVVDDCSQDNSLQVLGSFNDKRIRINTLNENSGAAKARNEALKNAKGQYITFIDSDDLWKPDFLEKSLQFLQEHDEALVYSNYERVDENLNKLLPDFVAEDYIDFNRLLYNCPIPMLTAVYDRSKVGEVMIPDVDLREDHAMWLNVLRKIDYARALNEPLGVYRMRDNSVSRDKLKIAFKQFDVYYKFLNFNVLKSLYYTFCWALNGLKKYGKL